MISNFFFFFFKIQTIQEGTENFGFKYNFTPPQNECLTPFGNDLYELVRKTEFRTSQNGFQKTLMSDLKTTQS